MKPAKLISSFLFVSFLAMPAFAKEGGHEKSCQRLLNQLELTVPQKQQLDEFRKTNKGNMRGFKDSIRSLKGELADGFAANLPDVQLHELHVKISEVKAQIGEAKFKKMMFLKGILSDEQRKEFIDLKKERRHKRKH